jgi:hypothetical protein
VNGQNHFYVISPSITGMETAEEFKLSIEENTGTIRVDAKTSSIDGYPSSLWVVLVGPPRDLVSPAFESVPALLQNHDCSPFQSFEPSFRLNALPKSESVVALKIEGDHSEQSWNNQDGYSGKKSVPVALRTLVEEIVTTGKSYLEHISENDDSQDRLDQSVFQLFVNAKQAYQHYEQTGSLDAWQPTRTREQLESILWNDCTSVQDYGLGNVIENSGVIDRIVADLAENPDSKYVSDCYHTLLKAEGEIVRTATLDALERHPDARVLNRTTSAVYSPELRSPQLLRVFMSLARSEESPMADSSHFDRLRGIFRVDLELDEELAVVEGLAVNDSPKAREFLRTIKQNSEYESVRDTATTALSG